MRIRGLGQGWVGVIGEDEGALHLHALPFTTKPYPAPAGGISVAARRTEQRRCGSTREHRTHQTDRQRDTLLTSAWSIGGTKVQATVGVGSIRLG